MKTLKEIANEWAETTWDESDLEPGERTRPEIIGLAKAATALGYYAGYEAAELKWHSIEKDGLPALGLECIWFDNDTNSIGCVASRHVDDVDDWWSGYTHWAVFVRPKEEK